MTISVGDKIPSAKLTEATADGPRPVTTEDVFSGKTVVLFAVPGAFTPTCHAQHMPGFVDHADDLKAKGADIIACVSVNDPFVMGAWSKQSGADGKITMLADGNADFTKALGLEFDGTSFGMGVRSRRYSMVVKDGVVAHLNLENGPQVEVSGADTVLNQL